MPMPIAVEPVDPAARWQVCGRKYRYSKRTAMRVARELRAHQPGQIPAVHAYRCPYGTEHYHVGHAMTRGRSEQMDSYGAGC